jgi:protein-disulfide isomerase|tara:strand:+ start:15 stop:623 length:609 start_codon:yes stop_codon:yes gene_type:complete
MREMNNYIYKVLFLIFFISSANAENKVLNIGNPEAKITVKVFSSLTCPHCANFHENIFEKLKKEYIDEGLVKFEHHAFPLDLAALNAEIIVRCHVDKNKNFQLLGEIYKKQKKWAVGSDIKIINNLIMKIGLDLGLDNDKMVKCLKNEKTQDLILNERIQAQQKYKIQSTPTIYIDKKKYNGEHKYKEFKKALNKILKKNEI